MPNSYEAIFSKLSNTTNEEKKANNVLTYRETPEEGKCIEDYVIPVAKYYAKIALSVLFLELKKYAFEKQIKELVFELWVNTTFSINALGDGFSKFFSFHPNNYNGIYTPTIQACIFNGIYGEKAKKAYMQQIRDLLSDFAEPTFSENILVYQNVTIIFCH